MYTLEPKSTPTDDQPQPVALDRARTHYTKMKYELIRIFLSDPAELFELLGRQHGQASEFSNMWQQVAENLPNNEQVPPQGLDVWYQPDVDGFERLLLTLPPALASNEPQFIGVFRDISRKQTRFFMLEKTAEPMLLVEAKAAGRANYGALEDSSVEGFAQQCVAIMSSMSIHPLTFTNLPMAEVATKIAQSGDSADPVRVPTLIARDKQQRRQAAKRPIKRSAGQKNIDIEGLAAAKRLIVWSLIGFVAAMFVTAFFRMFDSQLIQILASCIPLIVMIVGLIGMINMCSSLNRPAWSYIAVVVAWLLPVINLITLLIMNRRAKHILNHNGYTVGVLDIS